MYAIITWGKENVIDVWEFVILVVRKSIGNYKVNCCIQLDIDFVEDWSQSSYESVFVYVDAKWHSREDIKKALTFAEYEKAQKTAAMKVNQMCKGVERSQSLSADFNVESGELAPMFVPGPYAIAHHLIASWANGGGEISVEAQAKQLTSSLSNL